MIDLASITLEVGKKVPAAIYTAEGEPVCLVDSMKERPDDAAVARRIVACWNACRGVSTDELEARNPSGKGRREATSP